MSQKPEKTLFADLTSGLVVFLVALPLCLGVAVASGASAFSGVLAGIVGGILVGLLSGSQTSVSGPAAGLTAVVLVQIQALGFEAFLLAVVLAGFIQVGLGFARAGFLAAFFPSSVIKGLLAAIGVILILKQIPHVFGIDTDPEGDMSFDQPDQQTTFSELAKLMNNIEPGAAAIGLLSIALLVVWGRVSWLKKSPVPAPLIVVLFGVAGWWITDQLGAPWSFTTSHMVKVPVAKDFDQFMSFLTLPDFSRWSDGAVWFAGFTIAAVASLETLLNLEAVDKLDPRRRVSPTSRELLAQGAGNVASGMIGGLPVTSVIIRSSVNIASGGRTKLSTVFHGVLLLGCVALVPHLLNLIPISCLAAILLVTGFKLASPKLMKQMWAGGKEQFTPFAITVVAIVLTDLLIGVVIGLVASLFFILRSNVRQPLRTSVERHVGGAVTHVELASQVSFLNRAAIEEALNAVPRGGHILLDARHTDYIDPDILALIRDFRESTGPARDVEMSLVGFRDLYLRDDDARFPDVATREIQESLTPADVLSHLKAGNARFLAGKRLHRDFSRQITATAGGQHPLAVVLSCIDSRAPAEILFDAGVGDLFVARVAGNVPSRKLLGSIEYACAVAGAKLVLVMGHTRCGAVTAAVDLAVSGADAAEATGCDNIAGVVTEIQESIDAAEARSLLPSAKSAFVDAAAKANVGRTVDKILRESGTLAGLAAAGKIAVIGGMYDVATGEIEFMSGAT